MMGMNGVSCSLLQKSKNKYNKSWLFHNKHLCGYSVFVLPSAMCRVKLKCDTKCLGKVKTEGDAGILYTVSLAFH